MMKFLAAGVYRPQAPPPRDMLICGKMAQLFEYYLKYSIQDYISEFEIDLTVQKIIFLWLIAAFPFFSYYYLHYK